MASLQDPSRPVPASRQSRLAESGTGLLPAGAAIDREKLATGLAQERNLWQLLGIDRSGLRQRARQGALAHKAVLDRVETLCLFIGYQRSGHSLVGSLLDAHPQMAIAHELDALLYFKLGFRPREILSLMLEVSRFHGEVGRRWGNYNYAVPGQWQGRHAELRVVGDKKGGATTMRIARDPLLLKQLMARFGKRKRFVHVLRNPFDNIAAMVQRGQPLKSAIDGYFRLLRINRSIIEYVGADAVATLHHEDLVADPKAELARLCEFLGVTSPPDYLEACASIVFAAPNRSRHKIPWAANTVSMIERRIAAKPMIGRYRFED